MELGKGTRGWNLPAPVYLSLLTASNHPDSERVLAAVPFLPSVLVPVSLLANSNLEPHKKEGSEEQSSSRTQLYKTKSPHLLLLVPGSNC